MLYVHDHHGDDRDDGLDAHHHDDDCHDRGDGRDQQLQDESDDDDDDGDEIGVPPYIVLEASERSVPVSSSRPALTILSSRLLCFSCPVSQSHTCTRAGANSSKLRGKCAKGKW